MNYARLYVELINYARSDTYVREAYTESHHILPRCLGGSNDPSNLVELNLRHHFYAHRLLARIHNNPRIQIAIAAMSGRHGYSKMYETDRIRHRAAMRELMLGVPKTDEHKANISKARLAMDQTKLKTSAAKWISSPEFKAKQLLTYAIRRLNKWLISNSIYNLEDQTNMTEKQRNELRTLIDDLRTKMLAAGLIQPDTALDKILGIIKHRINTQ